MTSQPSYWIGADIGGTFTDLFVIDRASGACMTGKILTDHANPTNSIPASPLRTCNRFGAKRSPAMLFSRS